MIGLVEEELIEDEPMVRLSADLMEAARLLSRQEIRYLVDGYYQLQEGRKAAANQLRALREQGEPSRIIDWLTAQNKRAEGQIKRALDVWTDGDAVSAWAKSICGIGPVIAAGLRAHIDMTRAPTPGHIWRFAGLDPTVTWSKGEKRPWNAHLKVICWKAGQSFMKVRNNDNDYYGHLYYERKQIEVANNDAGLLATQAAAKAPKVGKNTEAYKWYSAGKLPPAHIDARARRWVVKLFLSHYHEVAYWVEFGRAPARPYVFEHLGHVDKLSPPNWP